MKGWSGGDFKPPESAMQDEALAEDSASMYAGLWASGGHNTYSTWQFESAGWMPEEISTWDDPESEYCCYEDGDCELPGSLKEAVSAAAEIAFGERLFGVCNSPEGGLVVFASVFAHDQSVRDEATAALCEQLEAAMPEDLVGLRAGGAHGSIVVEYLPPCSQGKCCWDFARCGACPRPRCRWWHVAARSCTISLQFSVVKDASALHYCGYAALH